MRKLRIVTELLCCPFCRTELRNSGKYLSCTREHGPFRIDEDGRFLFIEEELGAKAVLSESLLEHVADPQTVVQEMIRVLKPGGFLYASTPFLTPFHASPDDFTRWTKSGLRSLFKGCEPMEEGVDGGPWSAMLVLLAYFLGVILSFGSKRRAPFIGLFFMLMLGPLKIFDYIFARLPGADAVAAQLYFIGRKK